jgi:hypothetical protein
MRTPRRSLSHALFALSFLSISNLVACGDDDTGDPDGGTQTGEDATARDATTPTDSGVMRPDAEPRPDTGPQDAGHFCIMGGQATVNGTNVPVEDVTMRPTNPSGQPSITSCIDKRPSQVIAAPIRFRGCLDVLGAAPMASDLQAPALEISVFRQNRNGGPRTDPSYDRATGAERSPDTIQNAGFAVNQVMTSVCPSGREIELGRDAVADAQLRTDTDYIIRIRTSTRAAQATWVDTYFYRVNIRSDQLEAGSTSTDRCTPQTCSGRMSLFLVRPAALGMLVNASGANVPMGGAHAFVQANDCQDLPMANVTAGFSPAPLADGYLNASFAFDNAAMTTSGVGLLFGAGFTASSTVTGAVAITRDGACTEDFAGDSVRVFADSITVIRTGRENTLHR